MASNKKTVDKMVEMIKPFIPKEIVMTPIAYKDVLKQEKTISNVKERVKKDFLEKNRNYSNKWDEKIDREVDNIIYCRILIGNSNNTENAN